MADRIADDIHTELDGRLAGPKPTWLRVRIADAAEYRDLRRLISSLDLHTVCEEAHCPNMGECWRHRTATFMILGRICTRDCRFCAVTSGTPAAPDPAEPRRVAEAAHHLGLRHVVVTSVTRDDLPDGGAASFAATISEIRRVNPGTSIEVLIPDFQGSASALGTVVAARPEILNHNIETVRRLQSCARVRASYERSLAVLSQARSLDVSVLTKSGLMVGLGENWHEVIETLVDLRRVGCDIVTIGQYLQPSPAHLPIERYYTPDEFARLKQEALQIGFRYVESGPLVRSSYHAHDHISAVAGTVSGSLSERDGPGEAS